MQAVTDCYRAVWCLVHHIGSWYKGLVSLAPNCLGRWLGLWFMSIKGLSSSSVIINALALNRTATGRLGGMVQWSSILVVTSHVVQRRVGGMCVCVWICICMNFVAERHLWTHTHLTALFPGLPGWAGTRKVKPIWILQKQEAVSGSGISWAICNLHLTPDR